MATNNSSDNVNNKDNSEISLDLTNELKKESIIQKFVKNTKENYIEIELNHKYKESSIIIPTTVIKKKKNNEGWNYFKESVRKELRDYGISREHINQITTVLSRNYKLVSEINDNDDDNNNSTYDNSEQELVSEDQGEEEERKFLPQVLVELVLENSIKLFKDEFKVPHIQVILGDHYETLPIDSTKFKRYLLKLYYDTKDGKIANTEAVNSAISQLESKAFYEGRTIPLHLRVAWANPDTTDTIYYDLSDEKNRCIKITKDGWEIVENQTDVLFRRYDNLIPQVEPIRSPTTTTSIDSMYGIDSKMFDEFISLFNIKPNKENTAEDIKLLLKCYIISLPIPEIPKPIKLLHGEQGGAKSTFQELIKMLIDPSVTQTLTFPRDSNEFIQQLSHNYIAYYDNVSVIQDWISDLLCRAVTGSSFSKRALYTNDDDIYYNFKRIIGINGIDLAATKADLLDRSIITQTERIDKKDRLKIKKIWEKFNQLKPYVLGYIFDILAKVLRYKEEHGEIDFPNGLNRMADWEEYAEIISRCMGNPDGEFQRVYQENTGVQVDEAIESSHLSQTILEFMTEEIVIGTDEATGNEIKNIREE